MHLGLQGIQAVYAEYFWAAGLALDSAAFRSMSFANPYRQPPNRLPPKMAQSQASLEKLDLQINTPCYGSTGIK